MKERPIIMTAESVRAILAGQKTQTRRVIKPQPAEWVAGDVLGQPQWYLDGDCDKVIRCPYGVPGDRLWVRETHFRWTGCGESPASFRKAPNGDRYQTRGYTDTPGIEGLVEHAMCLNVSPLYMPRWASRLSLEILTIGVERVAEISTADAIAEGVDSDGGDDEERNRSSIENYAVLWDSINARRGYSWGSNPWVWVLTFRRAALQ